jgi:hypothetical protein
MVEKNNYPKEKNHYPKEEEDEEKKEERVNDGHVKKVKVKGKNHVEEEKRREVKNLVKRREEDRVKKVVVEDAVKNIS